MSGIIPSGGYISQFAFYNPKTRRELAVLSRDEFPQEFIIVLA